MLETIWDVTHVIMWRYGYAPPPQEVFDYKLYREPRTTTGPNPATAAGLS